MPSLVFLCSFLFIFSRSWIAVSTQSSMLTRLLPSSFLNVCTPSVSSLGCKNRCITNFFIYFQNGLKYLTRGTAEMLIPFMSFFASVSRSFLVILRPFVLKDNKWLFFLFLFVLFLFFRSSVFFLWFPLLIFSGIWNFTFLQMFWCVPDFVVLFIRLFLVSPFLINFLEIQPFCLQHIQSPIYRMVPFGKI